MKINGIKKIKTLQGETSQLTEGDLAVRQIKIDTNDPYTNDGSVRIVSDCLTDSDGLLPAEYSVINFNINKYSGETFAGIEYEVMIAAIKEVAKKAYSDNALEGSEEPQEEEGVDE